MSMYGTIKAYVKFCRSRDGLAIGRRVRYGAQKKKDGAREKDSAESHVCSVVAYTWSGCQQPKN